MILSKIKPGVTPVAETAPGPVERPVPPSTVTSFDLEGEAGQCVEDLFALLHDTWNVSIHCEVKGLVAANGS